MTVKDRVGRPRYVAFHVEGGPVPRAAIAGLLPEWVKLTRFDGSWGVARAPHVRATDARALLAGLSRVAGRPVRVVTLVTSGTLRGAAAKLPAEAGARERGRRA